MVRGRLAYDNARLPQALIVTGIATRTPAYVEAGLRSLRWLMTLQTTPAGHFRPVGTAKLRRAAPTAAGIRPAAAGSTATISACLAAWRADGDVEWKAIAANAHSPGFSAAMICRLPLVDRRPAAAAMACIPIAPTKTAAASPPSPICSVLPRCASCRVSASAPSTRHGACSSAPEIPASPPTEPRYFVASHVPEPAGTLPCVPIPQEWWCAHSSRRPNRAISTRPTRRARTTSSIGCWRSTDDRGQPIGRGAGEFPGPPSQSAGDIRSARQRHGRRVRDSQPAFTQIQRQLVGAYFLHEYSFEAAALFNPSIVAAPGSVRCAGGRLRFILSLRAVGEGHISSLTFRSGSSRPTAASRWIRLRVWPRFPRLRQPDVRAGWRRRRGDLRTEEDISERVIFPITESQSNGIEDARFVEFDEDGRKIFYATYTAYSGRAIRSELIETRTSCHSA